MCCHIIVEFLHLALVLTVNRRVPVLRTVLWLLHNVCILRQLLRVVLDLDININIALNYISRDRVSLGRVSTSILKALDSSNQLLTANLFV
jgi:hypothetical protein